MKEKLIVITLIVILIVSCTTETSEPKLVELTPLRTIDHFADTLFFGNIGQISQLNNHFYFFDIDQRILIKCDNNFDYELVLNKKGRGPGEYEYVTDFNFTKDGNLVLKEEPNLFKFYDIDFNPLKHIEFDFRISDGRFAIDINNFIYSSSLMTNFPIVKINTDGDTTSSFGLRYASQGGEFYKKNCQRRFLFMTEENNILAVGAVVPSVELYNTDGGMIFQDFIDYSRIKLNFNANDLKFKNNSNTFSQLYTDVFYADGLLYLIYWEKMAPSGKIECNELVIYRIESNGIKLAKRFKLYNENKELGFFTSIFTFNKTKLIAFCATSSKLQFYDLN